MPSLCCCCYCCCFQEEIISVYQKSLKILTFGVGRFSKAMALFLKFLFIFFIYLFLLIHLFYSNFVSLKLFMGTTSARYFHVLAAIVCLKPQFSCNNVFKILRLFYLKQKQLPIQFVFQPVILKPSRPRELNYCTCIDDVQSVV